MINFFKKLFGFKSTGTCPSTTTETVREILTPQEVVSTYVAPAKPANKKVKALSAPIKEGTNRANVKTPNPNSVKPSAPQRPTAKSKSKPKAKRK